eukprot:CAMPEP_0197293298 /NCGR_PEP_ID=MMETSP0890-20130614/27778_1 /TAXON_ID=44058 ORGANISM="Aureoumbra lagunensis, Strain CCMP1510" /NCGR_SAMPLE_ID=MMETSP0890 /ASSEMBLY_ACC=CAM_ASM_000533 /LENGTH=392 /DNA_ID=CAMNT_0042767915 /DNA_START=50 /DNA_END=1229 /DNA_ORIENTATION=-
MSRLLQAKVFMYDLRNYSKLWDVSAKINVWGAGRHSVNHHEQYTAALMLFQRISNSKCQVFDPQNATIFFVPLFPEPKQSKQWRKACDVPEREILEALPHMRQSNARRHFVLIAKTHRACQGAWFYEPQDQRLRSMIRLAYDAPLSPIPSARPPLLYSYFFREPRTGLLDRCHGGGAGNAQNRSNCFVSFPHVWSVPYPSSVRVREGKYNLAKLDNTTKRSRLMLFVGNLDKGEAESLRKRIDVMGRNYADPRLYYRPPNVNADDFTKLMLETLFCLQPGGDSPGRKSISDAVALGCIPVFFGNASASQYSWFFQSKDAHLDIDAEEFMTGKIDLKEHLQAISPTKLFEMQRALANVKLAFTYNKCDESGDAVDRIFDLVEFYATSGSLEGI